MPRIFDNIELPLLPALEQTLALSERADFCVGYFNLRGWRPIDSYIDEWEGGSGSCCRLLVGMQKAPGDEYRDAMRMIADGGLLDNAQALRMKLQLADEFKTQLTVGFQTNADESGLRRLAAQIKAKKVVVKLYLRSLHAKLYLLFRNDPNNPITGFLGSSNLTFSGLQGQGELNVDVLDHQATEKLAKWFEDRWEDRWCIDITGWSCWMRAITCATVMARGTDLSEGQNLQDSHIVVNYDLPWAIIRLIQRAGRVDRIGQESDTIRVYSALPAEGVNNIITLRDRLKSRLHENAEVVGTDEMFFEDDDKNRTVVNLYNEQSGILDDDADSEIDLSSYAYQVWKNAITADPSLAKAIPGLPSVIYSTKKHAPTAKAPDGVLVYLQTGEGNDALAWVDEDGKSVTESQYAILKAAECTSGELAIPRLDSHHDLVKHGVEHIVREEKSIGGSLGKPSSARFRTYERLKRHAETTRGGLFDNPDLHKAIEEIYKYPLTHSAVDRINSNLRSQVSDEMLSELVILLRNENRLCVITEEEHVREPRILCSMGLGE